MTWIRLALVLLIGSAACPPGASAQRLAEARKAVDITQVYFEPALATGHPATFRARIAPGAAPPIEYRWDFGDGGYGEGNGLMYRYARPGRYQVVVLARNRYGRDRDTVYVVVSAPSDGLPLEEPPVDELPTAEPPQPAPASPVSTVTAETKANAKPVEASAEPVEASAEAAQAQAAPSLPFLAPPRKGYTWVVGTFLHREAAEASVQQLRSAGYRTGLIVEDETGAGSPAYRVIVGEYATTALALRDRDRLPRSPVSPWLQELKRE